MKTAWIKASDISELFRKRRICNCIAWARATEKSNMDELYEISCEATTLSELERQIHTECEWREIEDEN